MVKVIDLSTPVVEDHFRWEGDRRLTSSHERGNGSQGTWLGWPCHGFTNVDARRHIDPDGHTTDGIGLEALIGEAAVVDLSKAVAPDSPIGAEPIHDAACHARAGYMVLTKTCWNERASIDEPGFWRDAPYMTLEAAVCLHQLGAKAVGFDFPQDRPIRNFLDHEPRPSLPARFRRPGRPATTSRPTNGRRGCLPTRMST